MQTDFRTPRLLGTTGLSVGRLGLASSYEAPARAYEQACERGSNCFCGGSLRRGGMGEAIRHLARQHRERMVLVLQSYSRWGYRLRRNIESGLRRLKLDHADILLLGWHNSPPSPRLMDTARRLKESGHPEAGERSAVIYTLLGSCRRQGINPFAYLKDLFTGLPAGG